MSGHTLDDFEDLSGWAPITSGQARLRIQPDRGPRGPALCLGFDFQGGGGFVVARRSLVLALPESYAFNLDIRGEGPSNILEFKLVDASGQNVWRWREDAFDLPVDWRALRIKGSQIQFAWGPLGGGPPRDIAAIEWVVAAGPGGQGRLCIADLRLEDTTYDLTPLVEATSALPGCQACHVVDPSPATCWRSLPMQGPQRLVIDFQREREYGGLVIQWDPRRRPSALDVRLSRDGYDWQTCFSAQGGVAEETPIYLPGACSRFICLDLREAPQGQGYGILEVAVQPHDFSRSINDFFGAVARRARPGLYPKYLLGRQSYWTPVGTGDDVTQALFNEEGLVEVDKGAFSIEPFLFAEGRLITWADAAPTQSLERGYLPIPSSHWQAEGLRLEVTAFAAGLPGASSLTIRYRVGNHSGRARRVTLFAAIRPFQVTPTWQHWQRFGGVSPIAGLAYEGGTLWVDGRKEVIPLSLPSGFGAASFAQGGITEYLKIGELPAAEQVTDPFGYASGALAFDLDLPPGAMREIHLVVPFGEQRPGDTPGASRPVSRVELEPLVSGWEGQLGRLQIRLPPRAAGVVETLKTAAAHILINRDGPALQPGPRRYSRSWIRDGALMAAALARVGLPEPGRDFIRWYSGYQSADGNLPDCVDRDGTEWLPEFDAWGQLIFTVVDYYRFSGDRDFLVELWPAVLKSVDYLEMLRGRRLTAEYESPEKRARYGLLPESMSHEGYMAHPVHAYWDDFWALRGLKDAAEMAEILGDTGQLQRISALRDGLQGDLYASLDLVIGDHGLDFVPGSVEFADFDPAATAIVLTVADELHRLPRPTIDQTFDRYLDGFRSRVRDAVPWVNYSAYEIRIIGALVRLGRRREAQEVLEFFLANRRIPAWNQWPEISWRDPLGPSFIGDMPHSWIGAEYILAVLSLLAYEREADRSLVIAAGIPEDWLDEGAGLEVQDLPTRYGPLGYRLVRTGPDGYRLTLTGGLEIPPGGLILMPPLPRPLIEVQIDGRYSTDFEPESARCRDCPAEVLLRF